jgi:hypothetical protein
MSRLKKMSHVMNQKPSKRAAACAAKYRQRRRRGAAALEVVLTLGVTLPFLAGMLWLGLRACGALFRVIGTLVGCPTI